VHFTARIFTNAEVAFGELLDSLLTIRSCGYIEQRIFEHLLIILKLTYGHELTFAFFT